jgi:hypothetical protein
VALERKERKEKLIGPRTIKNGSRTRRETAESRQYRDIRKSKEEEEEEDLLCKTYLLRMMISIVKIDGYIYEQSLHCN